MGYPSIIHLHITNYLKYLNALKTKIAFPKRMITAKKFDNHDNIYNLPDNNLVNKHDKY